MSHSETILNSWQANAGNWIDTITNGELESRVLATNEAIVTTVLAYAKGKILDLGCGEGWLCRQLSTSGCAVTGVDGVDELIEAANGLQHGDYRCLTYRQIFSGNHSLPAPFQMVVINFALLDKDETENLVRYIPQLLQIDGYLVVQTLHGFSLAVAGDYKSGWKEGSWTGLSEKYTLPYQWYFRTLQHWIDLFTGAGYTLEKLIEPVHPQTGKPLSTIFVLKLKRES